MKPEAAINQTPPIPTGAQINYTGMSLGCDPEFFFTRKGKIIGAEKVLPKAGTLAPRDYSSSKLVLDGVQVEVNPSAGSCREGIAGEIKACFQKLRSHLNVLNEKGEDIKASFSTVVVVPKAELESLSDKAKVLGCAPSYNREKRITPLKVNGALTRVRSAGGHIHMGLTSDNNLMKEGVRERIVDVLDILVGNTCVLIERDPLAAKRRKSYGRAGEYRLPRHGLEYRTLSNFWLRDFRLFSFVMGASRFAAAIVKTSASQEYYAKLIKNATTDREYYKTCYSKYLWDPEAVLLNLIGGQEGLKEIRKGINTNDYDIAKKYWLKVRPFIVDYSLKNGTGFFQEMFPNFDRFLDTIEKKGLSHYFDEEPIDHWCDVQIGGNGWENFITGRSSKSPFYKR